MSLFKIILRGAILLAVLSESGVKLCTGRAGISSEVIYPGPSVLNVVARQAHKRFRMVSVNIHIYTHRYENIIFLQEESRCLYREHRNDCRLCRHW